MFRRVTVFGALFQTRLEPRSRFVEAPLHVHNSVPAILNFAMRRHHPYKLNLVIWDRNVWMKPSGHQHSIAITHQRDNLRILCVRIDKLNPKRGRGHVEINIELFEHRGVLVRRPARPVAGVGRRYARENAAGFDVLAEQNTDRALVGGAASCEL